MPFKPMTELLALADGKNCAIVGCNVHNMEFAQGVVRAAEEIRSPVILMIAEPTIAYAGLDMISDICIHLARHASVPVSILLDHGKTEATIEACVRLGLSVMFDGSHLPFQENIAQTRRYARLAHGAGVSIEGELGALPGSEFGEEEREQLFTDAAQAALFVRETGVDALAVSIGNMHGIYKKKPNLDIARLEGIRALVDTPLVLHGGSDLPDDQVREAVSRGIRKVNFGTDLRYAFFLTLKECIASDASEFKPFPILGAARSKIAEVVRHKIEVAGSSHLMESDRQA